MPLQKRMRPIEQIYEAFAAAQRPAPADITCGSDDNERREIREVLSRYTAHDLPAEELDRYPLHTMFPFLSPASYRYFMPRFIEHCIANPQSMLAESLLFSLAGPDRQSGAFLPPERAVVREYLELSAQVPGAKLVIDHLSAAREKWHEAA
jgi:hypothetical protein